MTPATGVNQILLHKRIKTKHQIKSNFTQVIMKVKDFVVDIFVKSIFERSIQKLLKILLNCYDIERPGRSFERVISYKNRRKPLNYKAL